MIHDALGKNLIYTQYIITNMTTNEIPSSRLALATWAHAYSPAMASVSWPERNAHTKAAARTTTILLIVLLYPVRWFIDQNTTSASINLHSGETNLSYLLQKFFTPSRKSRSVDIIS